MPVPGRASTLARSHSAWFLASPNRSSRNPPGGDLETITETFSSPVPPIGPNALCGSRTSCPKIIGGLADGAPGSRDVAAA